MQRMAAKNPSWSDLQLRCVLYWQQTARKQLAVKIETALTALPGYEATWCPEGMGVNVTATLEQVGIILEWPPQQIARQVAFLGMPKTEQRSYRWLDNGEVMLTGDEFATRSTSGERYKPDDPNDIIAVWRPIPADNVGAAYNPYEFIAVRRIVNE